VFLSKIVQCTCYSVGTRVTPIIHADAAKIGITFVDHSRSPDKLLTPAANLAFFPNVEWTSDYPDPAAFLEPTFQGSTITPEWNRNPSLVGITVPQAHALGVTGRIGNVPSVDADLGRCAARTGDARLACYAELDRKLSTEIVPWIPFLDRNRISVIGRQVAQWSFDQSTGTTSFAHVALAR
jgi:hypothetical protein